MGGLRAGALGGFGDVADGIPLGRLRRVLLSFALNLGRGVEVGLPGARVG
jgi:hypothetical protein